VDTAIADVLLDTEAAPASPAVGTMVLFPETTTLQYVSKDSNGRYQTLGPVANYSTTAQAYTTTEIYLAGSALTVPVHLLQAGAICRWRVVASKTAGTGAPVWKLYKGTLGTTSDTAIATLTQASAPTSVADTAVYDIEAVLRNVGASGVMLFSLYMTHVLQITGFSQVPANVQFVASSSFDTTAASLIIGISANFSTAGAGNIEQVTAELVNT
jgi:hypothetical protein